MEMNKIIELDKANDKAVLGEGSIKQCDDTRIDDAPEKPVPADKCEKKTYRDFDNYLKQFPTKDGRFGPYGGAYLPDELIPAFEEITEAYQTICHSSQFISELRRIRREFQGRPTPVYHCERLSNLISKCQIYLKREDLNHTGAHKLNHCMGEGLLAKFMGKRKIIAETGAGQHGVALATAAAYFGLECDIYMGEVDIKKQAPNVTRMKLLGANVIPVGHGLKTLKEAVDAAFEGYMREYKDAIYCIGSVVGPHPFPMMVRDFQMVVGIEAREQFLEMTGLLPDAVVACVGGGSNAMGMFPAFLSDPVELYGAEPLGRGTAIGDHAASLTYGRRGIMHGFESIMLADENGEPAPVYSIASGLDYPSVGPEHAYLRDCGRVNYESVTDDDAMTAFFALCRNEGIIPAIESSHALALAIRLAKRMETGSILVNLSGRGDKDIDYVVEHYGTGEDYLSKL
jgi:tryptophan synthase beta chain